MNALVTWFKNPKHRAWIYGVLIAAGPLVIGAGITSDASYSHWLNLASAILLTGGGSLALSNLEPGDYER